MNWKFVYNTTAHKLEEHCDVAAKSAQAAGYKFMCWNDTVFFIGREQGGAYTTGLTIDDLFE